MNRPQPRWNRRRSLRDRLNYIGRQGLGVPRYCNDFVILIILDNISPATYEQPTFGAITALSLTLWKRNLNARTNRPRPESAALLVGLQHHQ